MSGSDYTQTPHLGLYKPNYDADAEQWGNHLNLNADTLDSFLRDIAPGGSYLPMTGGVMTGPLTLAADPNQALQAATKQYVDAAAPAGGPYLPLNGSAAMTGPLVVPQGALNNSSIRFSPSQSNSGLYAIGSTTVISSLGFQMLTVSPSNVTTGGPLLVPTGSTTTPSLVLGASDGTGLSRSGNALVVGIQGQPALAMFATGSQFYWPISLLGNKIVSIGDATDPADALNLRTGDVRYERIGGVGFVPEAPFTSDVCGRQGSSASWLPVLPLTGGSLSGGLGFGSAMAAADNNVTRHIQLHGAGFGFGVTPSRLNYVVSPFSAHRFMVGGVDVAFISDIGLMMLGATDITLARAPTAGLHAATKAYVDAAPYLPLTGGTLTGPLSATAINSSGVISMTGGDGIHYAADLAGNRIAFRGVAGTPTFFFVDINGTPLGSVIYSAGGGDWVGLSYISVHSGAEYMVAAYNGGSVTWPCNFNSDARLKQNVVACDIDALALVRGLAIWSADYAPPMPGVPPKHHDCTFLAHEVEPAVPRAYIPPPDEDGFASLSPMPLIATLWRAVQQLTEHVEAQAEELRRT